MNRRRFCQSMLLASAAGFFPTLRTAHATSGAVDYGATKGVGPDLVEVAHSPWVCNAAAVTRDGKVFFGLPRWSDTAETPSVARLGENGQLEPFPGGGWNAWQPGEPGDEAFVSVNAIHIFDDDTLWVVDKGSPTAGAPSQRLLQFDTGSGALLRTITFDEAALPPGAGINDLRFDAENIYVTDSGAGAILVHNLESGRTLRRLADHASTKASPERPPYGEGGQLLQHADGSPFVVHADQLEISPDGHWLYYQAVTGPLYRVPTTALRDESLSEEALAEQVEFFYDTPTLMGTGMDDAGNIYMAEFGNPRITVLSPDGTLRVLAEDDRLWGPDALFISEQREIYIPCPQLGRHAANRGPDGEDAVVLPYTIYKVALPDTFGGRQPVPPVAT
ncbi:major royal jelly family protein [Rhizobiaceae bacterium BDR2-2]|uniref:Major royal jelly family protein n=1 Tax=Ectorhizobium quercum TaxID=2965071 RepID=A0AAE3N566_9HYPH|nr:L-dopachrome tautomerase-related protein [Ectorhizobium quercum]MCX8999899.1 major royal jelly family protein [Ectorhizobium quercum]